MQLSLFDCLTRITSGTKDLIQKAQVGEPSAEATRTATVAHPRGAQLGTIDAALLTT